MEVFSLHSLLVGGAGFIGTRLAALLLSEGHQVTVLDNLHTGRRDNLPPAVSFFAGDAADAASTAQAFARPVDIVFYAAPVTGAAAQAGLQQILQEAAANGVKKFIYFSSAAVYGESGKNAWTEEAALTPVTAMGTAQQAAEQQVAGYCQAKGLPFVILRCASVYGDGAGTHGVVAQFCKDLLLKQQLVIYGDGNQSRDFVYVQDVARAAVLAMQDDIDSGIYNISTKIETTVNALKEILIYFSHLAADVSYKESRSGDIYRSVLDNHKAVTALKWRPKTKLLPGIMATYQYFLTQLEKGDLP